MHVYFPFLKVCWIPSNVAPQVFSCSATPQRKEAKFSTLIKGRESRGRPNTFPRSLYTDSVSPTKVMVSQSHTRSQGDCFKGIYALTHRIKSREFSKAWCDLIEVIHRRCHWPSMHTLSNTTKASSHAMFILPHSIDIHPLSIRSTIQQTLTAIASSGLPSWQCFPTGCCQALRGHIKLAGIALLTKGPWRYLGSTPLRYKL